jgi:hypothetical protein
MHAVSFRSLGSLTCEVPKCCELHADRRGSLCTDFEEAVRGTYGFSNDDALNDPLGAVDCEEGRVVAFPNVLQHCVQVCAAGGACMLIDISPPVLV